MSVQLFNTLSRRVETFAPLDPASRAVGMYVCGPTVHDFAHIGNFRTFVLADFLRRWLTFRGFAVTHVMNVTDVEDKIIRRVRETGTTLREFTGKYADAFFADHRELGCLPPHHAPRATAFIAEIIALITRLLARGLAYRAADGSVYFSIEKYRGCGCQYGRLLNLNLDQLRPGERVAQDEYAKEAVADFALWKARVPEDGDVAWPSPWGEGRPGWHIECSAMSMKLLGPSFDLHLGGEDLIFPHHEDEIAQSEGAGLQPPGRPFVKHWVHGAHLLVEGKKMSKSLGNFFTVRDLLAQGFTGREIRQLLLTAHYRETFNFTLEGLAGARAALARLDECAAKLGEAAAPEGGLSGPPGSPLAGEMVDRLQSGPSALLDPFTAALDDDLNVSAAWAAVFAWVREQNRLLAEGRHTPVTAAAALAAWRQVAEVFGLTPAAEAEVPAEVLALVESRAAAKKAKDFARADALRGELKVLGWAVEDTPKGPRVKRA